MKKRDKFWLNKIIWIFTLVVMFIGLSVYNTLQFNKSYILEEKSEIIVFGKQVEWAISPLLKTNDIKTIQKYCNDFSQNQDFKFRIFDENHKLIASTTTDNSAKIADNDPRLTKTKYKLWKLFKLSFKDKNLEHVNELNINNSKYYIEISISQEDVINSIIRAQKNVIILFSIFLILLILTVIQIFSSMRNSFNRLEDSVIRISKGELDTEIKIPRNGLLEELAVSVTKMTRRLKLQIARLSKLEQYKTEFLQNITHEIKTPITAINSAIELIETETGSMNRECFDIIKSQTNSINKLVNDILALSEIDLKKTEDIKDFSSVKLSEVLQTAIKNQGITCAKINLSIEEDANILANKQLFIMAISNLLSNALKYADSDIIDIIVRNENTHTIIEIKDYGKGIPIEHLPHIFERFYRVDKSRSREKGGTGLGLSIVKNITELHNWKIEAISIPNEGTIFKIII